jgi:hypothetical protein
VKVLLPRHFHDPSENVAATCIAGINDIFPASEMIISSAITITNVGALFAY